MQWRTSTPADAAFDVGAATGLYWRAVPVMIRLAEREEHVGNLTVRIMCSGGRNSHASRVTDPFDNQHHPIYQKVESYSGKFKKAARQSTCSYWRHAHWLHCLVKVREHLYAHCWCKHDRRHFGCGCPTRATPASCTRWTWARTTLRASRRSRASWSTSAVFRTS